MKRGSALIIVLWVIALLSVLIGGFAFDMHVESKIVSYLRKRLKAEYLAKAGLEYAQVLFIHSQEVKGKGDTDELKSKYWYDAAKKLHQGLAVHLTEKLGEGTFVLDIIPEQALRNINALNEPDWESVFTVGGIPIDKWNELIDCLNDWRDPDDEPSADGAETDDYYAKLDPPYKARGHGGSSAKTSKGTTSNNWANLDTVDELLLIKGWSYAILHGGFIDEGDTNSIYITGIVDLLTTSPEAGDKVNINAAELRVLMTLPGLSRDSTDTALATAIIAERTKGGKNSSTGSDKIDEDYSFKDVNDLFSRVPELSKLTPDQQVRLKAQVAFSLSVLRVRSSGVVHGVEYRLTSTLGTGK